jgi:hypothetical protein
MIACIRSGGSRQTSSTQQRGKNNKQKDERKNTRNIDEENIFLIIPLLLNYKNHLDGNSAEQYLTEK